MKSSNKCSAQLRVEANNKMISINFRSFFFAVLFGSMLNTRTCVRELERKSHCNRVSFSKSNKITFLFVNVRDVYYYTKKRREIYCKIFTDPWLGLSLFSLELCLTAPPMAIIKIKFNISTVHEFTLHFISPARESREMSESKYNNEIIIIIIFKNFCLICNDIRQPAANDIAALCKNQNVNPRNDFA